MQLRRLPTRFGGASRLPSYKRWRSFSAPPVVIPPEQWDVTPAPLFQQGGGQTYNIAVTGPIDIGYLPGGIYDSASGAQLPTGLVLSAAGMLTDTGAPAADIGGVIFGYTEPGGLPVLTLNSGSVSGTVPYWTGVYPVEGAVPVGCMLTSPEDPTLRSSTLSTWPDGSAKVMVVAGHKAAVLANSTVAVTLQPSAVSDTALTTADITSKFTSGISVDFGAGVGTLNTWTIPDRIWWANSQVICARYRLAIPGKGVMEAVIDVHAFAGGRAFVEVVIENGNINSSASTVATPASQSYPACTISVNGVEINGSDTSSTYATWMEFGPPNAQTRTVHHGARAWYGWAWVGGDPLIEVTHDSSYMQAHPAFHRFARTTSLNLQTFAPSNIPAPENNSVQYQNLTYAPWSTCYQRAYYMARGSDEAVTIGSYPQWDSFYLQTGNKYARRASIANALAIHSYPLNLRDSTTHMIPTFTQAAVGGKGIQASTWPNQTGTTATEPGWDVAHQPAAGLVAFLCRPSPVFIELAQKIALRNAMLYNIGSGFGFGFQTRGKGWSVRALAHAIFLTPDGDAWKSPAQDSIVTNMNLFNTWQNVQNPLDLVWDYTATQVFDHSLQATPRGFQQSIWEHGYLAVSCHKLAVMKVAKTANQALVDGVTDWTLSYPIRYVNEATGGEWRYHKYKPTIGTFTGTNPNDEPGNPLSLPTWTENTQYSMINGPPAESGPFIDDGNGPASTSYLLGMSPQPSIGVPGYSSQFWSAFCFAIERGLPGADEAWLRVNAGITPSLSSFLDGATTGANPRDHLYPRNK